jgi:hypothetical protein
VRTSRSAAIRVITELMNVHASLGVGIVAGDVVRDGCRGGLGGLFECHLPRDLRVSSDDGDYG